MEPPDKKDDRCFWCGGLIQIQIFKGSGHCSENCRKLLVAWTEHMKGLYKQTPTKET